MVKILRVDPVHTPETIPLTGLIARRVLDYAEAHQPDHDPFAFMSAIMTGLWTGLRDGVFVLVLVDGAQVVGHVTAHASGKFVEVLQIRADQNVGDGVLRALESIESWARSLGKLGVRIVTHKNPKNFEKQGYMVTHSLALKTFPTGVTGQLSPARESS